MHYNWHSYYDPETGRYITADPIGLEGGINLYAYVMGNPLNRIDREGKIGAMAVALTIVSAVFVITDIIVNMEYIDECEGKFTVRIPPPTMWKKGIPLPFALGVDVLAKEVGVFGLPIGLPRGVPIVTGDPQFVPPIRVSDVL